MFKINDKVVCVNAVPGQGTLEGLYEFSNGYAEHGRIYVVADVCGPFNFIDCEENRVFLVGLPTIEKKYQIEIGWACSRFRKLSDIKAENALKNKASQKITVSEFIRDWTEKIAKELN